MLGKPRLLFACAGLLALSGLMAGAASPAAAPAQAASPDVAASHQPDAGPARGQFSPPQIPAVVLSHGHLVKALGQQAPTASPDVMPWSGYVATACSTCHLRYVNANFTVPSISCADSSMGSDGAYMYIWAGLDSDPSVEQDGVGAYCTSKTGSPTYFAFWEIVTDNSPQSIPRTVKAGDSISISTYYDQSNGKYQFVFDDKSDSAGTWTSPYETCASGECQNTTAEVIVENPGGGPPTYDMPDFGSVTLSGTTVTSYDGTKGDLCAGSLWSSTELYIYASNYDILALVGPLSTCTGPDGFTDYFNSST